MEIKHRTEAAGQCKHFSLLWKLESTETCFFVIRDFSTCSSIFAHTRPRSCILWHGQVCVKQNCPPGSRKVKNEDLITLGTRRRKAIFFFIPALASTFMRHTGRGGIQWWRNFELLLRALSLCRSLPQFNHNIKKAVSTSSECQQVLPVCCFRLTIAVL